MLLVGNFWVKLWSEELMVDLAVERNGVNGNIQKVQHSQPDPVGWKRAISVPPSSDRFGEWKFVVVCKVDRERIDWEAIGLRLMEAFGVDENFVLYPFKPKHAVLVAGSKEALEEICKCNDKLFPEENISLFPWFPGVNNDIPFVKPEEGWIGISDLPFHLWCDGMFKSITESFGELVKIHDGTAKCKNLSMARILIRGDLGKAPSRMIVEDLGEEFTIDLHILNEQPLELDTSVPITKARYRDRENEDDDTMRLQGEEIVEDDDTNDDMGGNPCPRVSKRHGCPSKVKGPECY